LITVPAAPGRRWIHLLWVLPIALLLLSGVVLIAKVLREIDPVADFITSFPGASELPAATPVGLPAWIGWQHFLNAFFLLLLIRSGLEIRRPGRPSAFWTRNNAGPIRTKNPPRRMNLWIWFHLSIDALWVLNGVVFIVLIFVTGHWLRLVPTSWDVFPNALSVAIQYLSLEWPTENGWVNYNALQLLSYFGIVFIVSPLAFITGIRMSPAWPVGKPRLDAIYPIVWARAVHYPVMLAFVAFVIVHVALVLATGALRNLNHMYAARDDGGWVGFGIFAGSVVIMVVAWIAARPVVLGSIAALSGKVTSR
jgi:thiosulfate reductase cytochrome b subunit